MKRSILILALLLLIPLAAMGSGQTVVRPGQEVRIEAETAIPEPNFSWIIYQNEQEVGTKSGREFIHTFPESGEYTVVLLVENAAGESERSTAEVIVTENAGHLQPLEAVFTSLPPADATGNAWVDPAKPIVVLYGQGSRGDVVEYQYDFDIGVDTNGDGDPGNDMDNATHPSFTNGAAWGVNMKDMSKPVTARLTVKDRQGSTHSQDITFTADTRNNAAKQLTALIASVPPADQDGTLRLSGDSAAVVFYFGESLGQIGQFQFDRSIAIDSDSDGNPANDTDNRTHPSFTSAEPLQLIFNKTEGEEQYVQLTVVDSTGTKGSRIRRKVVFGPEATPAPSAPIALAPRLWVDYSETTMGTPLNFYVMGVPTGAVLFWDFDANGEDDKSGTETIVQHVYDTPGEYTAKVRIALGDETKELAETIVIKSGEEGPDDAAPPSADFTYTIGADGVTFTNASAADPRLEDRGLSYEWDFGDGEKSDEANPLHAYGAAGTYTVTLQVTDAKSSNSKKSASLEVKLGAGAIVDPNASPTPEASASSDPQASDPTPDTGGDTETGGSALLFIAKTIFYIVLLIFLLVGGYFVYRKIKDPDMSFGEIFEQELNRLSGVKPRSDVTVDNNIAPDTLDNDREQVNEASAVEGSAITIEMPEDKQEPAPAPAADAPLPPWLRPETPSEPSVFSEVVPKTEPTPAAPPKPTNVEQAPAAPKTEKSQAAPPSPFDPADLAIKPPDQKPPLPDWLRGNVGPSAAPPISAVPPASPPPAAEARTEAPPLEKTDIEPLPSVFSPVKESAESSVPDANQPLIAPPSQPPRPAANPPAAPTPQPTPSPAPPPAPIRTQAPTQLPTPPVPAVPPASTPSAPPPPPRQEPKAVPAESPLPQPLSSGGAPTLSGEADLPLAGGLDETKK